MSKMAPRQPKDTKGSSGTKKDSRSGQSAPNTSFRAPWSSNKEGPSRGNPNWSKGTPKEAHKGPMHFKKKI